MLFHGNKIELYFADRNVSDWSTGRLGHRHALAANTSQHRDIQLANLCDRTHCEQPHFTFTFVHANILFFYELFIFKIQR